MNPTLTSASIPSGGTRLVLVFQGDSAVQTQDPTTCVVVASTNPDNTGAFSGWSFASASDPPFVNTTLTLFMDMPFYQDEVITVDIGIGAPTSLHDATAHNVDFVENFLATNNSSIINTAVGVEWFYGNQQDVTDLMGAYNLSFNTNQEGASPRLNTDRLLRAGQWADAQINLGLKEIYSMPLTALSFNDEQIVNSINIDFTMAQLIHWRVVQYAGADDNNREVLWDNLMKHAQSGLDDLVTGKLVLDAARTGLYAAPAGNALALDSAGLRQFPSVYDRFASYYPWRGGY